MKITRRQLRNLIRESIGILNESYEDVVSVKDDVVVGSWDYSRLEDKRFMPTPEGEKRGLKSGPIIPDGTKKVTKQSRNPKAINESQENLPKGNTSRVRSAASALKPSPSGRFSATLSQSGEGDASVEVDSDTTVSDEHKQKLSKALRLDGVLGYRSGELDSSKTYKYVAVFT